MDAISKGGPADVPAPGLLASNEPPPNATFILADIHRLLKRHLPAELVPSMITLRRHSKSRLLKMRVPGASRRPKYKWGAVKALYEGSNSPAAGGGGAAYTDDQLTRVLGAVLEPLVTHLGELTKQVAGLPGVHRALMNKYDAATSLSQARAAAAEDKLVDARRLSDLETAVTKLTVAVARMTERLPATPG